MKPRRAVQLRLWQEADAHSLLRFASTRSLQAAVRPGSPTQEFELMMQTASGQCGPERAAGYGQLLGSLCSESERDLGSRRQANAASVPVHGCKFLGSFIASIREQAND